MKRYFNGTLKTCKTHLLVLAVMGSLFATGSAFAQAAATVGANAAIAAKCTISNGGGSINLTYDPLASADAVASMPIAVNCVKNSSVNITMNNGGHAGVGTQPKMQHSTLTSEYLNYNFVQPTGFDVATTSGPNANYGTCASGNPAWGTFNPYGGTTKSPTKETQTVNVCTVAAQGQDIAVGSYADSATATVNFS